MAGDYTVPTTATHWVRFYDGQFLQDQDFIDEQKYHLARANQHQRALHVAGVIEGLTAYLGTSGGNAVVKVKIGSAIDAEGRLIHLAALSDGLTVPDDLATNNCWLYISYHQIPAAKQTSEQGVEQETRWLEAPYISLVGEHADYKGPDWNDYLPKGEGPPSPVLLAKLTTNASGSPAIDNSVRHFSGLRLPGPSSESATLREYAYTPAPLLRTDTGGNVGLWMVKENDLTERITFSPEGKVGINTNTPAAALEIRSTLTAGTSSSSRTLVGLRIAPIFDANSQTNVKQYGLIVESGSVGIGTISPEKKLHIGSGELKVQAGHNDTTADIGAFYANNLTQGIGIGYNRIEAIGSSANQDILLMPKGSGKVGIGTTTPGAKLDVAGTIAASYLQMNPQNDKGEGGEIQLLGSGGAGNINIDNYYGNLRIFGLATDKQLQVSGKATINGNTMISGDLTVDTSTLYVDSTNNRVGIGTTLPGQQLAVSGNATISGNLAVDTSTLYVDSTNNRVGIGTVSPGTTLDVKGSTVVQSYLLVGQTSPTGYQNVTADSNDLIVNGQFAAGGSGGSAMYKLGIGYAPPSQGEGTLIVSGKVGIGTINPQAPLDVNGRILRNGRDFSLSGQKNHGEVVTLPWGTTDDWNILVSPRSMGKEEPKSEGDNALLMVNCWADASSTSWTIFAQYKYRISQGDGTWRNGSVNYLVVPK